MSGRQKTLRENGSARCRKRRRNLRLEIANAAIGIKIAGIEKIDVDLIEGGFGFDDSMPLECGKRLGKSPNAARRFSVKIARLEKGSGGRVQAAADAGVAESEQKADEGTELAARALFFRADFGADKAKQFRNGDGAKKNGEEPGVNAREPARVEPAGAEGPEEQGAVRLGGVESDVQKRSEEEEKERAHEQRTKG